MTKEQPINKSLWQKLSTITDVGIDSFNPKDFTHFKPNFGTCNPTIVRNHFVNDEAFIVINSDFQKINLEKAIVQESLPILETMDGPLAIQVNPFFASHARQTYENGKLIAHLFEKVGIDKSRYLIKIPATWEGIEAAAKLEAIGIRCVATTVFSLIQASTCAAFGISYIAPYVSRLHKARLLKNPIEPIRHYGVELVQNMHRCIHHLKSPTKILAASFSNVSEVFSVANCDLITVKPKIAFELQSELEVPVLYTWKERPFVEPANRQEVFDKTLLRDGIAPTLLAKTLNQFKFSWMNMRQVIVDKKEVLAAS